jgi:hypothetical protein
MRRAFTRASFWIMAAGFAVVAAFHLLAGTVPRPVQGLFLAGIGAGLIGEALRSQAIGWVSAGGMSILRARHPRLFAFYTLCIGLGGLVMLGIALWVLFAGDKGL